jgi:monoterpene epsilon-lactone hydrolase
MSMRAHVLSWTVRRQLKKRLGPEEDIVRLRQAFAKVSLPAPRRVVYEPGQCGGIEGEWVRPRKRKARALRLLYLHGGGFVACSARTHRPITGAFAARGFEVFAPNYRLAPEDRFPAGLDDVVTAWTAFAASGTAAVAGDSAGGNLALALMLRARAEGLAMPAAAALFSPATDLLGTGASYVSNDGRDAMFDPMKLRRLVPAYLGDADPGQPLVSPLYADLAGLPPLLIHVGETELLRDDSVRLADKARAAGVTVSLDVYPVVPHVWQIAVFVPEARTSVKAAAAFLATHMPQASSNIARAA